MLKNKPMKRIAILILSLLAFTIYAQSSSKLKEYRKNPLWIEMMEDKTVNYHEAVLAFDEFWKGKPEPEGELEGNNEGEEKEERSFVARIFKSDKRLKEELMSYATDFKKFRYWKRKYAAYVRTDGSIPTEEEIQLLIQQELSNRKFDNN